MAFGLRGFAAFGLGVRPKGVAGGAPPASTAPAMKFNVAANSQYIPLIAGF